MRWKIILIAVAVLATLFGSYHLYTQQQALAEARGAFWHAQVQATADSIRADSAVREAKAHAARADSAEAVARRAVVGAHAAERLLAAVQAKTAVLVAAAPDTCAPYLRAADEARAAAVDVADAWHRAYTSQLTATGELRVANDSLTSANAALKRSVGDLGRTGDHLAHASKPSFWSHLVPEIGVGATAGVDPITHKPAVAVGATASWRVL